LFSFGTIGAHNSEKVTPFLSKAFVIPGCVLSRQAGTKAVIEEDEKEPNRTVIEEEEEERKGILIEEELRRMVMEEDPRRMVMEEDPRRMVMEEDPRKMVMEEEPHRMVMEEEEEERKGIVIEEELRKAERKQIEDDGGAGKAPDDDWLNCIVIAIAVLLVITGLASPMLGTHKECDSCCRRGGISGGHETAPADKTQMRRRYRTKASDEVTGQVTGCDVGGRKGGNSRGHETAPADKTQMRRSYRFYSLL
jgi:hypothetical protein